MGLSFSTASVGRNRSRGFADCCSFITALTDYPEDRAETGDKPRICT
jgi:hypothetical protein